MMNHLITALQEWGMNEKEAKVYLTTLELGSAPASTIARRAGLKRVTGYAILRDFETKGVAKRIEKSGVSQFHVIDPKLLAQKLDDKVRSFATFVPELLAMTDVYGNKPKIEYFEGMQGMKDMYEGLLESQEEICAFLGFDEIPDDLHTYLIGSFLPRRIAAGISARVIVPPSEKNKQYVGLDQASNKETLMIDDAGYDFVGEVNIYGPNKVMFSSFSESEMSGIVFHSPKMYKNMKHIFELTRSMHTKKQ